MENVKVLDLYSGIGGLHYSLLQALTNCIHEKVEKGIMKKEIAKINITNCENFFNDTFQFVSIDLNCLSNQTHYHNFKENTIYLTDKKYIDRFFKKCQNGRVNELGSTPQKCEYNSQKNKLKKIHFDMNKNYIIQTDINNLNEQFFDYHKFFILLISNPCQPYTRQNKKFKEVNVNDLYSMYSYSITEKCPIEEKKKQKDSSTLEKSGHSTNMHTSNCRVQTCSDTSDTTRLDNQKCNTKKAIPSKYVNEENGHDNIEEHYEGTPLEKPITYDTQKYHVDNLNLEKAMNSLEIEKDERTRSFIHICNLLKSVKVENLPEYIFIENVKNFELSCSFLCFINSIKENYNFQTYLLSPLQFGIPNERLRFYCICKKKHNKDKSMMCVNLQNHTLLSLYSNLLTPTKCITIPSFQNNDNFRKNENSVFYTPSLVTFLDHNDKYPITCNKNDHINMYNKNLQEYKIAENKLTKRAAYCFDIIDINRNGNICCFRSDLYHTKKNEAINDLMNNSNLKDEINSKKLHAMCFTSNYSRYINGSGSILYFSKDRRKTPLNFSEEEHGHVKNINMGNTETKYPICVDTKSYHLPRDSSSSEVSSPKEHCHDEIFKQMIKYKNRVRYFTPIEICRLMGYKMRTNKNKIEGNKNKKNRYGNIYWNMDHMYHKCAYTRNVHYCASDNSDICMLNSELDLPDNHLKKWQNYENVQKFVDDTNTKRKEAHRTEDQYEQSQGKGIIPCLCHEFEFPEFLTSRQKHKLIGNSVNVTVIALIFQAHDILGDILKWKNIPS
ncbi:DNA (cytosine-5)-methyltransferase [Plasmodium gonderi]|uniref:DNA (Cytosine-5)-methyltransferase n=1 Tax=Plasmodium gonderi TaxID=77519 RepID=A0A1Y1JD61_PLAGO|nr:DNA (cytosine-5)-methyltransferase [Plasmodium gonderi]GAW79157.1 DNA (cytosine-5)-methyltransferase [Plasmodium gonderi]